MSAGPEGLPGQGPIMGGTVGVGAPPPLLTQDPNAPSAATGAGRFLQGPLSPQSFTQGLVAPTGGEAFQGAGNRIGPGLNQTLEDLLRGGGGLLGNRSIR